MKFSATPLVLSTNFLKKKKKIEPLRLDLATNQPIFGSMMMVHRLKGHSALDEVGWSPLYNKCNVNVGWSLYEFHLQSSLNTPTEASHYLFYHHYYHYSLYE